MQLRLGTHVRCAGEVVGQVGDVVIDPVARRLTHVVVETHSNEARLVPARLVHDGEADGRELVLSCTKTEFDELGSILEFSYVQLDEFPESDGRSDVGVETVISMPLYGAEEFGDYPGEYGSSIGLAYHRIPKGEAEVRRSSAVISSDGHQIGAACGFVLFEDRVTHVVLERGHLWGTRDITIPIDAVEAIETDELTLSISKDEVSALPTVRVHRIPFT
jgi:sporulation protein YlmC with PRC-barrel domain